MKSDGIAVTVLLKLLEQIVQTASQHTACGATRKQTAKSASQQITNSAAATWRVAAGHAATTWRNGARHIDVDRLSAGRYASIRRRSRRLTAGKTFHRFVCKQAEDRHRDR